MAEKGAERPVAVWMRALRDFRADYFGAVVEVDEGVLFEAPAGSSEWLAAIGYAEVVRGEKATPETPEAKVAQPERRKTGARKR